ncbi:MAG TPA: hypothetical protein VFU47_04075 [Armatimonadota bacterium]|nr:hypothetical protein [Armatimonadota bacterium]
MSVVTERTRRDAPEGVTSEGPPDFGRCPVCEKPLRPRCRVTGEPRTPPPGTGYESRAKCTGCGTVLCYVGDGEWRVLTEWDLTEDDRFADRMGF